MIINYYNYYININYNTKLLIKIYKIYLKVKLYIYKII